jgi:tetratricopeptide (TPR) repeat protein
VNFRDYRVELEDVTHHADVYRADVAIDGAFEFRHLPAGEFLLRVTALNGDIIHQEFVPVNSHAAQLDVRLRTGRKPSAPGTISVTQLRHPPDRKAIQACSAAQRLAPSSPEKAVEELEKAVRISPEFADAYTSLAVQHIRLRRFQEAVGELTRAIDIAGPTPLSVSNQPYADNRSRLAESIGSVRAALRLDEGYPPAHLILGSSLAADPRTRAEAIPHLEQAAESIPAARVMLEKVQAAR